jgi:hypothetical protein
MALSPPERDETLAFEVTVEENGKTVQTAVFDSLDEAEMFAENWTERVPGAHCVIEDRSHDHSTWETVQADTALDQAYPSELSEE